MNRKSCARPKTSFSLRMWWSFYTPQNYISGADKGTLVVTTDTCRPIYFRHRGETPNNYVTLTDAYIRQSDGIIDSFV